MSALAEMMFGNVSMKIVGDSVKVHYIRYTGCVGVVSDDLCASGPEMNFYSLKCLSISQTAAPPVAGKYTALQETTKVLV